MRLSQWAGLGFLAVVVVVGVMPQYRYLFQVYGFAHAALHVAVFCLAFWLIAGQRDRGRYALFGLGLLLTGLGIEGAQSRLYGTALEYSDVLYDAMGIALGISGRLLMP